jgi:hypothetical protein
LDTYIPIVANPPDTNDPIQSHSTIVVDSDSDDEGRIHMEPPLWVSLRGLDALTEMREMAVAGEEELIAYLRRMSLDMNGLRSRNDVVAFLELLDSLPLPVIQGAELGVINYWPETQSLSFFYRVDDSERYSFSFALDEDTIAQIRDELTNSENGEKLEPIPQENDRITVLSRENAQSQNSTLRIVYHRLEIDGYLIRVDYRNENKDVFSMGTDEIFEDLILSTFEELESGNIPQRNVAPNLHTADNWAHDHINEAFAKGFVPSDLLNNYRNNITRAGFIRLAMSWLRYSTGMTNEELLAEHGIPDYQDITFSDTDNANVLAAAGLGITAGIGNGLFGVEMEFDREQAAIMLMKVCQIVGTFNEETSDFGFADLNAAQWMPDAINFVGNNGIMAGKGEGRFAPKDSFQVQESITVFNKMG